MSDAVLLLIIAVVIVGQVLAGRKPKPKPGPVLLTGAPRGRWLHRGTTTETWRLTMRKPKDGPFPHTAECKTPDATPQWIPLSGNGAYERVCTCSRQVAHPPRWVRPDIFDPKVMRHTPWCDIADKPEMLKLAVTLKEEATYTFASCGVCSQCWYAWDQPPTLAEARR